ncbi:AP2/ERF family transcription factor [Candidatus Dependentiae bacterium]|nr:MAG: AP2/ERF family transcription factor [Candidatus Dependentiae bacterium]
MGRPRKVDIIGNVYGYLTVIDRAKSYSKDKKWDCICICGKTHGVTRQRLENGTTKSCGCMKKALAREKSVKHGGYRDGKNTPEYQSYIAMMHRCYDDKRLGWDRYGGRGITVCDRWTLPSPNGFLNFLEDMGERPIKFSLDRIDPDGNYEPSNCRWASRSTQGHNKNLVKNNRNTSIYRGVSYNKTAKRKNPWCARIGNGRDGYTWLGGFDTELEAAEAYNKAALELFGEDAKLNIFD